MDAITFTVAAVPVAQPRQRHRIINTGDRVFAQNYTPTKDPVNAFKAKVGQAAEQAYQGPPLQGPLALDLVFVLPRPGYLCWKTKPMPRLFHTSKPDADNLAKAVKDALSGLLWRDDCQVCKLTAEKHIAAGDEQPSVLVRLTPLDSPKTEAMAGSLFAEASA